MLSKDDKLYHALYECYCPQIYGQFSSFCRARAKAKEMTQKVFTLAVSQIQHKTKVKGSLLIWLLNISRKVSREYLLDYSVKKSIDERCIKRLMLLEGFNLGEAAGILGISGQEAVIMLRKELKEVVWEN